MATTTMTTDFMDLNAALKFFKKAGVPISRRTFYRIRKNFASRKIAGRVYFRADSVRTYVYGPTTNKGDSHNAELIT